MSPLEHAYRLTTYSALTPAGLVCMRVGCEEDASLARLLVSYGATEWAFVTACNPRSIRADDRDNAIAQARLEAELRSEGYLFFPGQGVGDNSNWPAEPSVLVLGMSRDQALSWGRRFEQNAVVHGQAGRPAQLIWCVE